MYLDRHDAGRQLGERLGALGVRADLVLGLARGGVPVALEVAESLSLPLDVVVVRRLVVDVGGDHHVAVGVVGEGGVRLIDEALAEQVGVDAEEIVALERVETLDVDHQVHRFRGDRPRTSFDGRSVIVVDDLVTTGSSVRAACRIVRRLGAESVTVAVPVVPALWADAVLADVDDVVALERIAGEPVAGGVYASATAVTDDDVVACLQAAARSEELRAR
jgi:putative phosphoribosyl transferase